MSRRRGGRGRLDLSSLVCSLVASFVAAALEGKGINVMLDTTVEGVDFGGDGSDRLSVKLSKSDEEVPTDLIVYTYAGSSPPFSPPSSPYGSLVNPSVNAIETDSALRAKDATLKRTYRNVFCIGDCASVSEFAEKSTAQTAMAMAETAAFNVYADVRGKKAIKFKYLNLGEMLTLGDDDATISGFGDRVKLEGGLASFARRAVYSIRQPTNGQRVRSGLKATGKGVEKIKERKNDC